VERLQTDSVTIAAAPATRTALTAAVPDRKMRFIVKMVLHGDGVTSRTVDIEKLKKDGTPTVDADFTMKFNDVPVAPADVRNIPEGSYDLENPILVLEGGTRPYGRVSAGAGLNVTTIYWDNDV